MKYIEKIILHNFKRFENLELPLNKTLNILIGENETGKSSILAAINLVLSGSRSQFEAMGAERLIRAEAVSAFLASQKNYNDLPVMFVEVWLNEQMNFQLNGRNNSKSIDHDGLRLECSPDQSLGDEIKEILQSDDPIFPFDYYTAKFTTFQGDGYSGYKKFLRHIVIDTAQIGSDYAVRDYVNNMYDAHIVGTEHNKHQYEYRKAKQTFRQTALSGLNERLPSYAFSIKNDTKTNLRTDLTLLENDIPIDNRGKGRQCFVKTDFALSKTKDNNKLDVVLLEEPENHLSHINMGQLISKIRASDDQQLVVATHSNLIASRLDLRNAILLHAAAGAAMTLADLSVSTAKFFLKAPDHGILDFALSQKVILVEGDAEYILMDRLFQQVAGAKPHNKGVYIMAVDGLTFKRYLDVAKILGGKVAVLRDNDKNYQANCVDRYADYDGENIKIFADADDERSTFEICIYQDNEALCEKKFAADRRTLSVQDYMLNNKTEAALALLDADEDLSCPDYVERAIRWITT